MIRCMGNGKDKAGLALAVANARNIRIDRPAKPIHTLPLQRPAATARKKRFIAMLYADPAHNQISQCVNANGCGYLAERANAAIIA
jgi:hypothetical protein